MVAKETGINIKRSLSSWSPQHGDDSSRSPMHYRRKDGQHTVPEFRNATTQQGDRHASHPSGKQSDHLGGDCHGPCWEKSQSPKRAQHEITTITNTHIALVMYQVLP